MTLSFAFTTDEGPWFPYESRARSCGYLAVAGVDEVGRGCLAGPVVAAAVILPDMVTLEGVADSKQLTFQRREELFPKIREEAVAVGVGMATAREVEDKNVLRATHLAMQRAVELLDPPADFLFVDGNSRLPVLTPQKTIIKGDSRCLSIAASSIIAKVTRDRMMIEQAEFYPQYGFERHKGYGTTEHRRAIAAYGPCELHRRTFKGVAEFCDSSPSPQGINLQIPLSASKRTENR